MNSNLELQLKTLPSEPGVYRYYDKNGQLLYVGKAKNLKKRVLSYFNKNQNGYRTRIMVSKIVRLETTVVNSEYDALLLENNLIKEHQPFYNVMLKDDKTYPWICIKNENFPRVFLTEPSSKMEVNITDLMLKFVPLKFYWKQLKICIKFVRAVLIWLPKKLKMENTKFA